MQRIAGKVAVLVALAGFACVHAAEAQRGPERVLPVDLERPDSDRVVTYSGWIYSGFDAAGDLYFALDEAAPTDATDGRIDRIFVVQLAGSEVRWEIASEPFDGWISFWGDRLEVGTPAGGIMARILVPQADNYARVKRWLESSEAAPAVKAAGLVENVPRPERAATVEDFLIRVATSGAQQAIREFRDSLRKTSATPTRVAAGLAAARAATQGDRGPAHARRATAGTLARSAARQVSTLAAREVAS